MIQGRTGMQAVPAQVMTIHGRTGMQEVPAHAITAQMMVHVKIGMQAVTAQVVMIHGRTAMQAVPAQMVIQGRAAILERPVLPLSLRLLMMDRAGKPISPSRSTYARALYPPSLPSYPPSTATCSALALSSTQQNWTTRNVHNLRKVEFRK